MLGGLLTLWTRIYGVVVNHTVMAPPDNDIHDSRCAVNHYYASLSAFQINLCIDNSGVNVFLISASIEGASHTYSRLSCLVLVGKSLLRTYGKMDSTAYTVDSILAIVLSS